MCLMINATTLKHLEKYLESEINEVFDWMIANKLTLNISKSNYKPNTKCSSI